jgi:hypothetical protein
MRQSVQTAGKLPEKLSASVPVGVIREAMMGDQSWGKWWWIARSVGGGEGAAVHFPLLAAV